MCTAFHGWRYPRNIEASGQQVLEALMFQQQQRLSIGLGNIIVASRTRVVGEKVP
jgi:hypothetical protein